MSTPPLTGLERLELRRRDVKPGADQQVLRANGDVDTVYFRAVAGIDWSDATGNPIRHDDIVLAPADFMSLYAGRLVIKAGLLTMRQWVDALQLAHSHAGGASDPYAGRYNGWAPQDIADDWIKRLATGGRAQPYGGSHVVTGP